MKIWIGAALALAAFASAPVGAQSVPPARSFASLTGRIVDTAGHPVEGAMVALPDLRRQVLSNAAGSFRFDSVPRGQWIASARKIGYVAQTKPVDVDSAAPPVEFRLVPAVPTLVPIVTSAARLGLSGTVKNVGGKPVPKARVRVLGSGLEAQTDSAGTFWMPAPAGNHMIAVAKQSFAERVAGVTIPTDSGRDITIWLRPASTVPVNEAWNVEDLRERIAWARNSSQTLFTREALQSQGYEWIYDVLDDIWVRLGRKNHMSPECVGVSNGGPATVPLGQIAVDDVESIEVYTRFPQTSATVTAAAPRLGTVPGGKFDERSNTRKAEMANGSGPCLAVYVWLR